MEKSLHMPKPVRRRQGPKKLFLSRISSDSDSFSNASAPGSRTRSTSTDSDVKLPEVAHGSWAVNHKSVDGKLPENRASNQTGRHKLNQSTPDKNQLGTSLSSDGENQSNLDLLTSFASPKHQRVESLSVMSLPDDLRLSFSEIEDSSLQLDDLDLTCSPNVDGSNNDQNDSELHKMTALISSTSDKRKKEGSGCQKREKSEISAEFQGNDDLEQGNNLPKSENSNTGESGITWDDLITWGANAQQVSTVGSTGEVLTKKKVSRQRSTKNKHMENVSCQVCGDLAAGFYCGAFICEACKKFYMRAYKQDKLKYVCLRDKKCVITKESRVQCQYCRFQKCVNLNMYIPKQGENEMSKDMQMCDIPCRVCSAPSSGFHFGAITCEGCKGFFRRMAKEREPERYQCNKKGNCEINMVTRNLCKACRYRACLQAGMSVEGSRIGRQPNSVKHAISMELKQGKSDSGQDNSHYYNVQVKEEPGESGVDFLNESDKSDMFFWNSSAENRDNLNRIQNYNEQTSSYDNIFNMSVANSSIEQAYTGENNMNQASATYSQSHMMAETSSTTALSPQSSVSVSNMNRDLSTMPQTASDVSPHTTPRTITPTSPASVDNHSRKRCMTDNSSTPRLTPLTSSPNAGGPRLTPLTSSPNAGGPKLTPLTSTPNAGGPKLTPLTSTPNAGGPKLTPLTSTPNAGGPKLTPLTSTPNVGGQRLTPLTSYSQQGYPVQGKFDKGQTAQINQTMESGTGNTLVFTPSPVSQFFSAPQSSSLSTQSPSANPKQSGNKVMRTTGYSNSQSLAGSPIYTHTSPTALSSPGQQSHFPRFTQQPVDKKPRLSDSSFVPTKDMDDFISKIVEAGKCLQLLNYRVFDTDVNPTTSMNVDDIKALFKSKYMDPRAGNHITSKVDISIFSSRESTWNYMMTNFHHNTYITIRFAKLVPGFKSLSLNDQVKLIQSSIYPIELLNMSKVFDPTTRKYNYFTYTKEEENIMMEQFPMLRVFQEHFLHVGEMVTSFQFTDEEFAILSALLLFPAEINGLENPKAVEDLQSQMSAALQYYEEKTFPDGMTRYGILLVRVAELVQCLLQHNLAIGLLLTHNPTIKVPQLFHELIIESIKEGQKT